MRCRHGEHSLCSRRSHQADRDAVVELLDCLHASAATIGAGRRGIGAFPALLSLQNEPHANQQSQQQT